MLAVPIAELGVDRFSLQHSGNIDPIRKAALDEVKYVVVWAPAKRGDQVVHPAGRHCVYPLVVRNSGAPKLRDFSPDVVSTPPERAARIHRDADVLRAAFRDDVLKDDNPLAGLATVKSSDRGARRRRYSP